MKNSFKSCTFSWFVLRPAVVDADAAVFRAGLLGLRGGGMMSVVSDRVIVLIGTGDASMCRLLLVSDNDVLVVVVAAAVVVDADVAPPLKLILLPATSDNILLRTYSTYL